jgi:hypothetical protein
MNVYYYDVSGMNPLGRDSSQKLQFLPRRSVLEAHPPDHMQ